MRECVCVCVWAKGIFGEWNWSPICCLPQTLPPSLPLIFSCPPTHLGNTATFSYDSSPFDKDGGCLLRRQNNPRSLQPPINMYVCILEYNMGALHVCLYFHILIGKIDMIMPACQHHQTKPNPKELSEGDFDFWRLMMNRSQAQRSNNAFNIFRSNYNTSLIAPRENHSM